MHLVSELLELKLVTVAKDGGELPCGAWELNSGPLEEWPVLSTAEPSRGLEGWLGH